MNVPYSEKLRDPRWQKKRLEKMQAAQWKCEICSDDSEELQVHHTEYVKRYNGDFVDPWQYELNDLKCLCKTCHTIWHLDMAKVRAHCKRVAVTTQIEKKCIFDRTLRLVPKGNLIKDLYDDTGIKELLNLQFDIRQEYLDFHQSVKDRVNEIYVKSRQRREAAE